MSKSRCLAILLIALVLLGGLHLSCCKEQDCDCCAAIKALSLLFVAWRTVFAVPFLASLPFYLIQSPDSVIRKTPVELKTLLLD